MKTLGLANGDLVFKDGDFVIIDEEKELLQCLEIMLSTRLGEWFLNLDFGIDYNLVLEKPIEAEVVAEIARVLGQEERVEEIIDITVNIDSKRRNLGANYTVRALGSQTLSGEVNIYGTN